MKYKLMYLVALVFLTALPPQSFTQPAEPRWLNPQIFAITTQEVIPVGKEFRQVVLSELGGHLFITLTDTNGNGSVIECAKIAGSWQKIRTIISGEKAFYARARRDSLYWGVQIPQSGRVESLSLVDLSRKTLVPSIGTRGWALYEGGNTVWLADGNGGIRSLCGEGSYNLGRFAWRFFADSSVVMAASATTGGSLLLHQASQAPRFFSSQQVGGDLADFRGVGRIAGLPTAVCNGLRFFNGTGWHPFYSLVVDSVEGRRFTPVDRPIDLLLSNEQGTAIEARTAIPEIDGIWMINHAGTKCQRILAAGSGKQPQLVALVGSTVWVKQFTQIGDEFQLLGITVTDTSLATSVSERPTAVIPGFELAQNYPNPFNPSTTIEFSLPRSAHVTLTVFNSLGQELETIFSGTRPAGNYSVIWDAADRPSGYYFYRLEADGTVLTKKMLLVQ